MTPRPDPDARPLDVGDELGDDGAFLASTLAALRADSAAEQDERLLDTLRAAPRPSAAPRRARRPRLTTALVALAAALLAAVVTYAVTRPAAPPSTEEALALDGGSSGGTAGTAVLARDAEGRPTELVRRIGDRLDGERILFRAGRVIRIEHYRDGVLDGPTLDFDGLGRLVALRTYAAGVERGPYLEVGPDGQVRASGER